MPDSPQPPDVSGILADIVSLNIILANVVAHHLALASISGFYAEKIQADLQKACLGAVDQVRIEGPARDAARALIAEKLNGFFGLVTDAAKVLDAMAERSSPSVSTN